MKHDARDRINYRLYRRMPTIKQISTKDITPGIRDVLDLQGIPKNKSVSDRVTNIINDCIDLLEQNAEPVSIIKTLDVEEALNIFNGESENDNSSPIKDIIMTGRHFTLFALTVGEKICNDIQSFFDDNKLAEGAILDSVASAAADKSVDIITRRIVDDKDRSGLSNHGLKYLSYSPGYCGWHLSGQKKLFHALKPGSIGIDLNNSFLMAPIKSVSGMIIGNDAENHVIKPQYDFCKSCRTHSCVERNTILSN